MSKLGFIGSGVFGFENVLLVRKNLRLCDDRKQKVNRICFNKNSTRQFQNRNRNVSRHVFLPGPGNLRDDDEEDIYDEDGYLIDRRRRNESQEKRRILEDKEALDLEEDKDETEEYEESLQEKYPDRVLSAVDLFDDREALFRDSDPSYETWRDRNKLKSLSAYRNGLNIEYGADELNEIFRPDYLERHRFILAPDEAFGAIFTWSSLLQNARDLEMDAWNIVATENNLLKVDLDDIVRAEQMNPELAVQRVFLWTSDWIEVKRLVFRKLEVYNEFFDEYKFELRPNVKQWLTVLRKYKTSMCICSNVQRNRMKMILERLEIAEYFPFIVSIEEEFDTEEQMFLSACVKLERPPQKCVIFTDTPTSIISAHEISAKAIALSGVFKAYELRVADATMSNFDDIVVYDIRKLFSESGYEFMDTQTQLDDGSGNSSRSSQTMIES